MRKFFQYRNILFDIRNVSYGTYIVNVITKHKSYQFRSHNSCAYDRCDNENQKEAKSYQRELYYEYVNKVRN